MMGRFFAEERYIRQMPYLRNESDRIWFVIERKERAAAFASLRIMDTYGELEMPVRTATGIPFIRDCYIKQGFKVYRETIKF